MDAQCDMPDWLEITHHPDDAGIVITAENLGQLYERAAWSMFRVITHVAAVQSIEQFRLAAVADDRQSLMVRWLSELNFRHVTERRLYGHFVVTEASDTHLIAEIAGEPIDPARHTIHTQIRAVTFQGLQIEKRGEQWRAQIVFDL